MCFSGRFDLSDRSLVDIVAFIEKAHVSRRLGCKLKRCPICDWHRLVQLVSNFGKLRSIGQSSLAISLWSLATRSIFGSVRSQHIFSVIHRCSHWRSGCIGVLFWGNLGNNKHFLRRIGVFLLFWVLCELFMGAPVLFKHSSMFLVFAFAKENWVELTCKTHFELLIFVNIISHFVLPFSVSYLSQWRRMGRQRKALIDWSDLRLGTMLRQSLDQAGSSFDLNISLDVW